MEYIEQVDPTAELCHSYYKKATTQPSTQQINSFIKPSNVTNAPSGDLQTQLTQALARIKELSGM